MVVSNLEVKLQSIQEQNGNSLLKHSNAIRFLREAVNYIGSFYMWKVPSRQIFSVPGKLAVRIDQVKGVTEINASILQKPLFQLPRERKTNSFLNSKAGETE